ncbi:MAG: hypothetical protein LBF15_01660 [Candidatus Peribacteria bacterium]|jgi:uncharacterized ferredoxin-like protein|nr:hypothetical protein [Candidatus Peribacteria bacterium]
MALRTEKEGRYVDDIIKRILSNEETREKAIALLDEKNDIEFARGLEKL